MNKDYSLEPDETWDDATPQEIPEFTYWPIVTALGLLLICWGILTLYPVFILGLIAFFLGVIGWIIDLRETFFEETNNSNNHNNE